MARGVVINNLGRQDTGTTDQDPGLPKNSCEALRHWVSILVVFVVLKISEAEVGRCYGRAKESCPDYI